MDNFALRVKNDGGDYILSDEHPSCWIEVDGVSLFITRHKGGVAVEAYDAGLEMDSPRAEMIVSATPIAE